MTFLRPVVRVLLTGFLTFALVPPCVAQRTVATNVPKELQLNLDGTVPYGQRTDAFRRLLFEFRFTPVESAAELLAEPDKSILIVLGDTNCLSNDSLSKELLPFVQRGGAVLIATDRAVQNPQVRENVAKLAGVRVTGEKLWLPTGDDLYEGQPYCPFVQPIAALIPLGRSSNVLGALAAVVGAGSRPELFRNPYATQDDLRVATNAPSRLQGRLWGLPRGIHRLAQLPSGSVQEDPIFAPSGGQGVPAAPLFAVGGTIGKGRVLVLADHSVFINRMILPGNNQNLEFAANCLHWLRGGASSPLEAVRAARDPQAMQRLVGQRHRVLFYDDGIPRDDFKVPLRTVPIKPSLDMSPALAAAVDQTLAKMEKDDDFNRGLLDGIDDLPGGRPRALRNAVYLLTLLALLLLGYFFLWRGRYRPESAVPLLAHALSQHEPRTSGLELRRRAMLRSGNVWELAHQLARQYFASAGIPLTGASAPRVWVQGGWWRRWRVGRRVARLWQLARGDAPARIPPVALNLWLRELKELNSALANGTIKLMGERPA